MWREGGRKSKGGQVPNIMLKPTSSERAAWTFPVIAWALSNLDGYEQETQLTLHAGYPLTFSFSCL